VKSKIFLYLLVSLLSCSTRNDNKIYIFKIPGNDEQITIKIEDVQINLDTLTYSDDYNTVPAKLIASYMANKSKIKINLQINKIDTTFIHTFVEDDSLIIGMSEIKQRIFVFLNRDYVWAYD
jgi:hypothetical protein